MPDLSRSKTCLTLTRRDYAAHAKLSPVRVKELVAEGMPLAPDGRIDAAAADTWRKENLNPARQAAEKLGRARKRLNPAPSVIPFGQKMQTTADLRRQKAAIEIEIARSKLAERDGSLIPRADAQTILFEKGRGIRDSWIAWIARTAPVMAQDLGIELQAAYAFLDRHVRDNLGQLSEMKIDLKTIVEEPAE